MIQATKDFQSAFHRGNGCYSWVVAQKPRFGVAFSPLFIGAMVATPLWWTRSSLCDPLSVPFSSGQWLLLVEIFSKRIAVSTFSPLFIGAMVATN